MVPGRGDTLGLHHPLQLGEHQSVLLVFTTSLLSWANYMLEISHKTSVKILTGVGCSQRPWQRVTFGLHGYQQVNDLPESGQLLLLLLALPPALRQLFLSDDVTQQDGQERLDRGHVTHLQKVRPGAGTRQTVVEDMVEGKVLVARSSLVLDLEAGLVSELGQGASLGRNNGDSIRGRESLPICPHELCEVWDPVVRDSTTRALGYTGGCPSNDTPSLSRVK